VCSSDLKKTAFTLIEIMIVLTLIVMTLLPFYLLGVYSYRQFIKVHKETAMKTDVANIKFMIESDLARGGTCSINSDHHGIKIILPAMEKHYLLKKEAIYLQSGNKDVKLTAYPVSDGLWLLDDHIITMNVEYRYKNINTGITYFKVIKDIECEK
jgi:Tfp pilus assembly protein PilE